MRKTQFFITLLLLFFCLPMVAQNVTVSGTVTDASDSESLIGVSVVVKGTSIGTITDFDGKYSLAVPSNSELVFSYLGYTDKVVKVGNQTTINVKLESNTQDLDEVVVVGTVMKKSDLTGAVGSVSGKVLSEKPVVSINQALQGRVAGVLVNSAAKPGDDSSIKIRGINTINGSTDPIYVVDGLVMDNFGGGFNSINVNDIESIEIMKDASSTALYGSRAANGVVVVTTKKGKRGDGKVNYDGWFGFRTYASMPKKMNSRQLYELRLDAASNSYKATHPNATEAEFEQFLNDRVYTPYDPGIPGKTDPSGGYVFGKYEMDAYADPNFKDYDWLDEVTRTGLEQNHAVSFSGASDKGSYFLSFGYSDQSAMVKKLSNETYTGRINADFNIKPWLKVGTNTSYVRSESQIQTSNNTDATDDVYDKARGANPMLPISDVLVLNYGDYYDQNYFNPLNTLRIDNDRTRNRLISSNFINVNPIAGLNIRSSFSLNYLEETRFRYTPNDIQQSIRYAHNGEAMHTRDQRMMWQWENTVSYDKTFGIHRINGVLGTSASKTERDYMGGTARGYDTNVLNWYDLGGSGNVENRSLVSDFVTSSLMSYFVRANYVYDNKYFLTATARYDGSSKFRSGNRWGLFPSFSLAWDMVQEDFMKDLNFIDQLKLRVGYGKVGNQEIDDYSYYTQFYAKATALQSLGLVRPDRMGNRNIKWESQGQFNVGFDSGFLNNRIRFSADYFHITNKNLLMKREVAPSMGHKDVYENVGEIVNQGVEFSVEAKLVNTSDIKWNVSANISADNNEVKKLVGGVDYVLKYDNDRNLQKEGNLFTGKSRNTIYIWKTGGIAQEADMERFKDMDWAGRQVNPGDLYPQDISGPNGVPDGKMDDYDRILIDADPDFYGGFATDFTYKGISLNAVFTYSYGAKKLSYIYESMIGSNGKGLASKDLLDRWTPENTGAKFPRPILNDPKGSNYSVFSASDMNHSVQSASYLRLSTLTLAYTLPQSLLQNVKISNLRLYATASNLFCITPYKGYDPETGDWYPPTRMFTFGVNLSF
ncbi:TonB-dependent receptor [Dysgonomonas sp. 520]|uniref:SusC/RagA family TonB-linked outer membrane protein n=1 Tax=Dysgonomonas sp. 520 TaxID=2302931 RepID=UPI0013D75BD6|nr:TonB-dependent receptor [Dysgonomonas sp. 520]NDW08578.1 TonB-dependent receptor [Dysgonomonas sp. 520]